MVNVSAYSNDLTSGGFCKLKNKNYEEAFVLLLTVWSPTVYSLHMCISVPSGPSFHMDTPSWAHATQDTPHTHKHNDTNLRMTTGLFQAAPYGAASGLGHKLGDEEKSWAGQRVRHICIHRTAFVVEIAHSVFSLSGQLIITNYHHRAHIHTYRFKFWRRA